ncbi:MAG: tRNA dihydrouridine synthase DusB [Alphaproteobacteria bacterium]
MSIIEENRQKTAISSSLTPFQIGQHVIETPVLLAPMSGITDLPFRQLVRRFGAGLVVSEMIASRTMISQSRESMTRATMADEPSPRVVQLAGCDPDLLAEAAVFVEELGADIIDINMGCPAKKVVKGLAGSALMRDLDQATRLIEATVKAVSVPVTLKMRTGWDDDNRNAPELARRAEKAGIQMLTVHGRTRCQFYKGHADWAFLQEVRAATKLPLIVNGDICSVKDATQALELSGANGIMVGRGAQGRPWFLQQLIDHFVTGHAGPDPDIEAQGQIVLDHLNAMLVYCGDHLGVRIFRKHLGWYVERLPGGNDFRAAAVRLTDPDALRTEISKFYENQSLAGVAA